MPNEEREREEREREREREKRERGGGEEREREMREGEISSQFFIIFSLFSFILALTFISLQIKEFRIMGLSINDSVYSCLFFCFNRITCLSSFCGNFHLLSFLLEL